jgi:hypothetical protein
MKDALKPPTAASTSGRAHARKVSALLRAPGSTPLKAKARPAAASVLSTSVSSPRSAHASPPAHTPRAGAASASAAPRASSSSASLANKGRLRTYTLMLSCCGGGGSAIACCKCRR